MYNKLLFHQLGTVDKAIIVVNSFVKQVKSVAKFMFKCKNDGLFLITEAGLSYFKKIIYQFTNLLIPISAYINIKSVKST